MSDLEASKVGRVERFDTKTDEQLEVWVRTGISAGFLAADLQRMGHLAFGLLLARRDQRVELLEGEVADAMNELEVETNRRRVAELSSAVPGAGSGREHVLSKDCWCQPTVENFDEEDDDWGKLRAEVLANPEVRVEYDRLTTGDSGALPDSQVAPPEEEK